MSTETEPTTQVHGGRLVARRLKAHGVSKLFTLSGGHLFSIYDGCREEGIDIVDVRHEQAAAFAAEGAAREAGRILAQAETLDAGATRAQRAVELAFSDQGFDVDGGQVLAVTCAADPCLTPGAQVLVQVGMAVDLPLVPDVVRAEVPAEVPVSAAHLVVVDDFREPR